jgi:gluconolactonase
LYVKTVLAAAGLIGVGLATASVVTNAAQPPASKAPRVLVRDLKFPEGPAVSPNGHYLYCVNVQANYITRYNLKNGEYERDWATLPEGGRGNGSVIGPDGALYVADVGRKSIERVSLADGSVTTIVDTNEVGGALLGPNDIVFDGTRAMYFTDPDGSWNAPTGAVYRVDWRTKAVTKVAGELQFPNGIALTGDGRTLYTVESPLKQLVKFAVSPEGPLTGSPKQVVGIVGENGGGDGMRLGRDKFLYMALFGDGVIAKVSADGKIVKRIPAGGKQPTNLCFSKDGKTLFVTETETNTLVQVPL